jgi:three-Cys-motif partner protein
VATTRTDKLDTVWPLEDHTAAKHDILRGYLNAWFPIMGHRPGGERVVYIDGFAGPGVYANGQPGSPILALRCLVDHQHFDRWKKTFTFVFVENDKDRFESLEAEIQRFWTARGGKPVNVRIMLRNAGFTDVADEILVGLGKHRLAPTFAFIDPFGFRVPLDTVARLVAFPHCEVFFNFMFNRVNQFLTAPQVGEHMEALFGTDRCFDADGLDADAREAYLLSLYGEQLRTAAQMPYVHRFTMIGPQNKQVCTLFYGTRSLVGVRKMKEELWKIDPVGGGYFSDVTCGMATLFTPDPDLTPLRRGIIGRFNTKTVKVADVDDYVVGATPFLPRHYKAILRTFEELGQIEILGGRKQRFKYPSGTIVRFCVP